MHVRRWGRRGTSGTGTAVTEPESGTVTYGLADFVAAEEMDRMRGYWWAPDGESLLVARVDEAPVARWHIADPANPDRTPAAVRYPAAGTTNPAVTLRSVGSGKAAAFAYDLATSIVYTRQGNPAWAGQKRDTSTPPTTPAMQMIAAVTKMGLRYLRVFQIRRPTAAPARRPTPR